MCLVVDRLWFILFGALCTPQTGMDVSFPSLDKFLPLSLFFLGALKCECQYAGCCPRELVTLLIKHVFCSSGSRLSISWSSRSLIHSSPSFFHSGSLLEFWVHLACVCRVDCLLVSISFGSFPEVSGFCLEHILHLVCAYFCEVGGTATSFLGVKKRSRGRMSGIDCGAGAGVWTGDPRALQRALQQDSWGLLGLLLQGTYW